MNPGELEQLVKTLLVRLPIFIVWVVGLIMALAHARRSKTASTLMIASIGVMFFVSLVSIVGFRVVQHFASSAGRSGSSIEMWLLLINLLSNCGAALAWLLIFFAVFADRPNSSAYK